MIPSFLHADVTVADADTGIPGIGKVYDAHLTNYSPFPVSIERCEFITDAFAHEVIVGYTLEQCRSSS